MRFFYSFTLAVVLCVSSGSGTGDGLGAVKLHSTPDHRPARRADVDDQTQIVTGSGVQDRQPLQAHLSDTPPTEQRQGIAAEHAGQEAAITRAVQAIHTFYVTSIKEPLLAMAMQTDVPVAAELAQRLENQMDVTCDPVPGSLERCRRQVVTDTTELTAIAAHVSDLVRMRARIPLFADPADITALQAESQRVCAQVTAAVPDLRAACDELVRFAQQRFEQLQQEAAGQWHLAEREVPSGALAEMIMAAPDAVSLCQQPLQAQVASALLEAAPAGTSPPALWYQLAGPRLIQFATERLPDDEVCWHSLLKAAVTLAANLPGASANASEFAERSGLRALCDAATVGIRDMLSSEKPWERMQARSQPWTYPQQLSPRERGISNLENAYAAELPRFCPRIGEDDKARTVMFHQFVLRRRLEEGNTGSTLVPVRARVFSSSFGFLNGPIAKLLAGLPEVEFDNEPAVDEGGVQRDWFAAVTKAAFETPSTDPLGGLFKTTGEGNWLIFDNEKMFPAGAHPDDAYRAAGRLLAFTIATRLPAIIPLPVSFFAMLLNDAVSLDDLKADDQCAFNGIRDLHEKLAQVNRDLAHGKEPDYSIIDIVLDIDPDSERPTEGQVVQLVRDYEANRIAPYYANTDENRERMTAFRQGFNELLPIDTVRRMVTPAALRVLASVTEPISAEDIIAHSIFKGGYSADQAPVTWLFNWLRGATQDELRKFIQFTTGLPALPAGGAGSLHRRIQIRPGGRGKAPQSHTCVYQFDMPRYESEEELREWVPVSISADGFGMG